MEQLLAEVTAHRGLLEKNKNFEIMLLNNELAHLQKQFDGLELCNL